TPGVIPAEDVLLDGVHEEVLRGVGCCLSVEVPLQPEVLVDRRPIGLDEDRQRDRPRLLVGAADARDHGLPGGRKGHLSTLGLVTTEWNATSYHKVSGPQTSWGLKVLGRLELRGDERV